MHLMRKFITTPDTVSEMALDSGACAILSVPKQTTFACSMLTKLPSFYSEITNKHDLDILM